MTLTDDPTNRVPIAKPDNFQPLWHEALVRKLQFNPDTRLQAIISLAPMPNHKADTNGIDFVGGNHDYPAATYQERARIAEQHRDYALGMLWTLAHDDRVPAAIRVEMKPWGLPRDEFADHGNFPHQLYAREARRMRGAFVMKEENVRRAGRVDAGHCVSLGSYALDSHVVCRFLDTDGQVRDEGSQLEPRFRGLPPYSISYHALVPQPMECRNLLVPVCSLRRTWPTHPSGWSPFSWCLARRPGPRRRSRSRIVSPCRTSLIPGSDRSSFRPGRFSTAIHREKDTRSAKSHRPPRGWE